MGTEITTDLGRTVYRSTIAVVVLRGHRHRRTVMHSRSNITMLIAVTTEEQFQFALVPHVVNLGASTCHGGSCLFLSPV